MALWYLQYKFQSSYDLASPLWSDYLSGFASPLHHPTNSVLPHQITCLESLYSPYLPLHPVHACSRITVSITFVNSRAEHSLYYLLPTLTAVILYCIRGYTAAAAKSLQSCPTLCNPLDSSPPGSAVPGILQARILEWVAISFSNEWKWKVKVKSLSDPMDCSPPGSSAHGIVQARVLEWGAIAFSNVDILLSTKCLFTFFFPLEKQELLEHRDSFLSWYPQP